MINLSKSGDTIVFEFINNGHYLENGTIEVPVNSLSLVIDSSNMAVFKKAASNDVFIAATYDELGMTKAELETFYKENMAGSTGGGGITSGEVQTMIDESISGKQDTLSAGTGIEISGNVISATGGGGGTVSSAITSGDTNAVAGGAVYDKFDEVESVTARALIDVNEKFGGLKLVKLSQAQYDALSGSTDSNTLYVIV